MFHVFLSPSSLSVFPLVVSIMLLETVTTPVPRIHHAARGTGSTPTPAPCPLRGWIPSGPHPQGIAPLSLLFSSYSCGRLSPSGPTGSFTTSLGHERLPHQDCATAALGTPLPHGGNLPAKLTGRSRDCVQRPLPFPEEDDLSEEEEPVPAPISQPPAPPPQRNFAPFHW